ncbi:cobyrinate a,c-diamide synthase [Clostridium boliviensis]|uniref:Cobyrinate a,c-diamide synthase n=1 Tax=Clostridium boliviensis TaxID=318465 RepID=A0ABU4GN94_9CLOT|nr:cobyrinate a,c-diamide synthase [Clostridium boliviensis]MDW2799054.1 cobyrinate a,c-diamide synthase [Clostridium boliviensis]
MSQGNKRIMLAAPKSGSGKTMITCGLLQAFLLRGISCRSFKCGPDYIDPMFHKAVLGIDGGNLDTFFLDTESVRELFIRESHDTEISVIEGVMGYYDGMGGDSTWASSYEVACAVEAPVVLILDCRGASLSLAAVLKGFLEYRKDCRIEGVILNRISSVMAERLTPQIEALGIRVYGYLPQCAEADFSSRHLGLKIPGEVEGLKDKLKKLAYKMEETVDIDGLFELSETAPLLTFEYERNGKEKLTASSEKVRVGIAVDEAFCFYYQENRKLLEEMGAELIPFSPLRDSHLPYGICGLILGGGYPELYLKQLSENQDMLGEIRDAAKNQIPILAECGGFLYLHEELESEEHEVCQMAGVIPGRAFPTGKLKRFGYIEAAAKEDMPFLKKGESVRGHEFHYWDSTNNGTQMEARKPGRNVKWDCVLAEDNVMAGFPHFYYPSNRCLPEKFLEACRQVMKQKRKNL